jgi:hypothetical protein
VASAHLLPSDPLHQHLRCALAAHLEARGTYTAAAANHLLGGQPAAAVRALLTAGSFPAAAAAAEVCARAILSQVSEEKRCKSKEINAKDIKTGGRELCWCLCVCG